jgi:hypothetical protein
LAVLELSNLADTPDFAFRLPETSRFWLRQ